MKINYEIRDTKLQYHINREAAKNITIIIEQINKYECFAGA